jgi:ATP-dependent Clp protease ATP-binding subunit ClpC
LDKEAVLKLRDRFREIVGLKDPNRPISFIFLGQTGVGKTQLAKVLAKEYLILKTHWFELT